MNFRDNDFFILYANCIPTKGASRSLISDLQRHSYFYIPNDLFDILELAKKMTLGEIYSHYTEENKTALDEYFDFLIQNNLGLIDDERDVFPDLSLEWDAPSEITNSIIDISESKYATIDYEKLLGDLSHLNCECIQIRSFEPISSETVSSLADLTLNTRIKEIRFLLPYTAELDRFVKESLVIGHKRVSQLVFFNSPENKIENFKGVQLCYKNIVALSDKDCGHICASLFSVNIQHHTEALKFNSCLNRKVSVDTDGNIKNCPSQRSPFGNVRNISVVDVILEDKFKDLWRVKKDDISVCKDCEHRYICTDCRVFIQDQGDAYSKPSKCTYDPYTVTWN